MALAEQTAAPDPAPAPVKRWTPKRALVTP
ncbi:MAG: hypothetical protein JWO90_1503, partial [Solirubrobacterales bacterium]|nr:hypothetical protein [Solirubrobacterales bacterium]